LHVISCLLEPFHNADSVHSNFFDRIAANYGEKPRLAKRGDALADIGIVLGLKPKTADWVFFKVSTPSETMIILGSVWVSFRRRGRVPDSVLG
jgi:hypothetical protein